METVTESNPNDLVTQVYAIVEEYLNANGLPLVASIQKPEVRQAITHSIGAEPAAFNRWFQRLVEGERADTTLIRILGAALSKKNFLDLALGQLRAEGLQDHQLTLIKGMIDQMRGFNQARAELRLRPAPVSPESKRQLGKELVALETEFLALEVRGHELGKPDLIGARAKKLRDQLLPIVAQLKQAGLLEGEFAFPAPGASGAPTAGGVGAQPATDQVHSRFPKES